MAQPTLRLLAGVAAMLLPAWAPTAAAPPAAAQTGAAQTGAAQTGAAQTGAAPSLANARWVGFTPALVTSDGAAGDAWIAGPFAETGATGWVTDTVSGLTAEVRLIWRDAVPGGVAELSAGAGRALGLTPGAVANVAVYVGR
jgi:hypothetical protein